MYVCMYVCCVVDGKQRWCGYNYNSENIGRYLLKLFLKRGVGVYILNDGDDDGVNGTVLFRVTLSYHHHHHHHHFTKVQNSNK